MNKQKITRQHVEQGLARIVQRGRHIVAEWAPAGTQLRMPMTAKKNTGENK